MTGSFDADAIDIELKRKITAKEARELTEKDNDFLRGKGRVFEWKAGDSTERFPNRESLEEAAIKWFNKHGRQNDVLLAASHADPCRVLGGPVWFCRAAKALYEQAEQNNGWEGNEKRMQKICDEWDALIGRKKK